MGIKERQLEPDQSTKLFSQFLNANTLRGILNAFHQLCDFLDLRTSEHNFYWKLRSKLNTWKAQSVWAKLDKKALQKEYKQGTACEHTRVLIIGAGPCGLRTAIEAALLGARAVVVEKRDRYSRNNVLHLWPSVIHDLKSFSGKKFYGKFCAGSIDHISIRQLQCMLLKTALVVGVDVQINVGFEGLIPPPEDQSEGVGWKAIFSPGDHPLSEYEFDVLIGADGKRNTLEGFKRKEFRGKLAIAITANFVNFHSTEEAKVEEISGVAFIFNQKFFQDLKEETGIDLENIVYYKDETHYFVMTAKKQSLLEKGVLIQDFPDTAMLLARENVNHDALLAYAKEAADYSTKKQLPVLEFAQNHYGQADIAMFDFTSMFAAINASHIIERRNHKLLCCLVGDSLVEPFWPTGSGCARGFLGAQDAAWVIRSFAAGTKTPLEVIAERESIYQLLSQTTPENLNKIFSQHTIDPYSRYPTLNIKFFKPAQVRNFFDTDNPESDQVIEIPLKRRKSGEFIRDYDRLLRWYKKTLHRYKNVKILDLSTSWKNGLGFCYLIHYFRPDLIDVNILSADNVAENNQKAFDILEKDFGISPIMTGIEMASCEIPDRLTLWSYLSQVHETFKMESSFKELFDSKSIDSLSPDDGTYRAPHSPAQRRSLLNRLSQRFARHKKERQEPDEESGLRSINVEHKPAMTFGGSLSKRQRIDLPEMPGRSVQLSKFNRMEDTMQAAQEHLERPLGVLEMGPRGNNKVSSLATKLFPIRKEPSPQPLSSQPRKNSLFKQLAHKRQEKANVMNEMINTGSGSQFCYFCEKRVYLMERMSAEGIFFHRGCLKCEYCSTTLRLGNYAFDRTITGEAKFYCIQHMGLRKRLRRKRSSLERLQELEDLHSQLDELETADESPPPRPPLPKLSLSRFARSPDKPPAVPPLPSMSTPERVEFENSSEEINPFSEEATIEHNLRRSLSSVDFDNGDGPAADDEEEDEYDDEDDEEDDDEDDDDDDEDSEDEEDGSSSGDSNITALSEREIMEFLGSSSDESDINVSSLEDIPMTWDEACKLADKLKRKDNISESCTIHNTEEDEDAEGNEVEEEEEEETETETESDSEYEEEDETEEETEEEDEDNVVTTKLEDDDVEFKKNDSVVEVVDITKPADKSLTPRSLGLAKEQFFNQMSEPVRIDHWAFFRRNKLVKEKTPPPEEPEVEPVEEDEDELPIDEIVVDDYIGDEVPQRDFDHTENDTNDADMERQFEELSKGLNGQSEEEEVTDSNEENTETLDAEVESDGLDQIVTDELTTPKYELMEEVEAVTAESDNEMHDVIYSASTQMPDMQYELMEEVEAVTAESDNEMHDVINSAITQMSDMLGCDMVVCKDELGSSVVEVDDLNTADIEREDSINSTDTEKESADIEDLKDDSDKDLKDDSDSRVDSEDLPENDEISLSEIQQHVVHEEIQYDDQETHLAEKTSTDESVSKSQLPTDTKLPFKAEIKSDIEISEEIDNTEQALTQETDFPCEVAVEKEGQSPSDNIYSDNRDIDEINKSIEQRLNNLDERFVTIRDNRKQDQVSEDSFNFATLTDSTSSHGSSTSLTMEVELNKMHDHDDTLSLVLRNQSVHEDKDTVLNGYNNEMDEENSVANSEEIQQNDFDISVTDESIYITPDSSINETNNNKPSDDPDKTPVVSPVKSTKRKHVSPMRSPSKRLSPIRNLKKFPLSSSSANIQNKVDLPVITPVTPPTLKTTATRPGDIDISPIYRLRTPRYEMEKRKSQTFRDYSIVNVKKPDAKSDKEKRNSSANDYNDALKILMGGASSKPKTKVPIDNSLMSSNEDKKPKLPEGRYKVEENRRKILSPHISFDSLTVAADTSDMFSTPATSMKPPPRKLELPQKESTPLISDENEVTKFRKQREEERERWRAVARERARRKTDEELGIEPNLLSPSISPELKRPVYRRHDSSPVVVMRDHKVKTTLFPTKESPETPIVGHETPRNSRSLPSTPIGNKVFASDNVDSKDIVIIDKGANKSVTVKNINDDKIVIGNIANVSESNNVAEPNVVKNGAKSTLFGKGDLPGSRTVHDRLLKHTTLPTVEKTLDINNALIKNVTGVAVETAERTSFLAQFDDDSDLNVPSPEKTEEPESIAGTPTKKQYNERAVDVLNERPVDVPVDIKLLDPIPSTSNNSEHLSPTEEKKQNHSAKLKKSKSFEKLSKSFERLSPKKAKKVEVDPNRLQPNDEKEQKKEKRKSLLAMFLPKSPEYKVKKEKKQKEQKTPPKFKGRTKTPKSKEKKKGKEIEGDLLQQVKQLNLSERKTEQRPEILIHAANTEEDISDSESERGSTISRLSLDRISVQAKRSARAARKQQRQKELRRLRMAQEIQRHLQEIEVKQKDLEDQGIIVEKALRGEGQGTERNENQLMQQWFNLVHEKNALVRYESELMVKARELELEDRHGRLEQQLRERMSISEDKKSPSQAVEEKKILNELLEVVEQRDSLVSLLEEDRVRQQKEDENLQAIMTSKGFQLSPLTYNRSIRQVLGESPLLQR